MGFQHILFEARDGVARLTLNRPDALNSLTDAMHIELRAALDQVQADPAIRVLVLSGAGRGFCAGQDLADPGMQAVDGKLSPKSTVSRANTAGVAVRLYELGGVDLDTITALENDWTQAAQLPLTGWFTKNIDVEGDR